MELLARTRLDDDLLGLGRSNHAHELGLLRLSLALQAPNPPPERTPRPQPLTLGVLAARHAARTPSRDALHPGLPIGHALDADRGRPPRHHGAHATDTVFARAELEKVQGQRGLLRSAFVYVTRQEDALRRVLENPHLKLDNNASERALRRVAIGRKNWLFVGSDDHAQTTANLLSIVASAKLHDLEPEEYVRDLLRVLPHWPRDRYLELAPKYWRATRERLDAAQLEAELGPLTVPPPRSR
jgi:hypothetical protein